MRKRGNQGSEGKVEGKGEVHRSEGWGDQGEGKGGREGRGV